MGNHAVDRDAPRGQVTEHGPPPALSPSGNPNLSGAPASPSSFPESAVTTRSAAGSRPFETSTASGPSRRETSTPASGATSVADPPVRSRARDRSRVRFCSIRPPTIEASPFGSASANLTRGTRAGPPAAPVMG